MAAEARRGCGYRRIGGTYLEGSGQGIACGRFPITLVPCPLCDHAPPFSRGLQKIAPKMMLHAQPRCSFWDRAPAGLRVTRCNLCPLEQALAAGQAALMWVGERFYPTPGDFLAEAEVQGVSKRVPWPLPKWVEIGKTWVFLAHEKGVERACDVCGKPPYVLDAGLVTKGQGCEECDGLGVVNSPAVFQAFQLTRVVRIIPKSMPETERDKLAAQGLALVEVPDDDPDHAAKGRGGEE